MSQGDGTTTRTAAGAARARPALDVLRDHLACRRDGRTDEDLERNYADDVVVLSHLGHFRGKDSVRVLAALLDEQLHDARFHFDMVLADEEYAFVHWSAQARDFRVSDGADAFAIRDGLIIFQSIYYSLSPNEADSASAG